MAKILIVEDDLPNRSLLATFARRAGFEVLPAGSVGEAQAVLDHTLPALILMDIRIPGGDGVTLTRQIKADPRTAHIPVIAVTATMALLGEEEAQKAGFAALVTKPIELSELERTIRALLGEGAG
jgi:CheY-like chemotaxis protein